MGRRATGRCERDCTLIAVVVVVFVADNGAVLGRTLLVELVGFPFNVDGDDGFVTDGFTREGITRDITPLIGVEACNNTQTYTQMCLGKKNHKFLRKKSY